MTAARMASGDPAGRRFAAALAAADPFEKHPHLAVALSGGADSSALVLLARDWALARGGRVTALTVDHGLRSGSDAEAAAVAAGCAAAGIDHVVLRWEGVKPGRAIQERARAARYALLESWCREAGVLHLLLGHHAEDQAETIALRRAKRSGADGLDGMPAIAERTDMRLLRPLLSWRKADLITFLAARGAGWIEDPSNRDPRFARARLRAAPAPEPAEAPPGGGKRHEAERARALWLGRHAAIHPEGWASLGLDAWRRLPVAEAMAMLRAGLMTVSGSQHPPRGPALADAAAWALAAAPGTRRSVAGCMLVVSPGALAILRNPGAGRAVAATGPETWFDRRLRVRRAGVTGTDGAMLVPLRSLHENAFAAKRTPALIAGGLLPAVRKLDGSAGVLHVLCGRRWSALVSVESTEVAFRPIRSLAGAAFAGPETAELSSTPESPGLAPIRPRLPERRVVPP